MGTKVILGQNKGSKIKYYYAEDQRSKSEGRRAVGEVQLGVETAREIVQQMTAEVVVAMGHQTRGTEQKDQHGLNGAENDRRGG